jgi:hypothetical protein
LDAKQQTRPEATHGAMPLAGLPASLAGSRVLNLGPLSPEDRDRLEGLGAARVSEETSPLGNRPGPAGGFDFIHCGALPVGGRQLLVLSRLWHLAAPSASLLLGSRVLDDVEASRYLGVAATSASGLELIPGRLALRWMVECSGFDVLRWLAAKTVISDPSVPFAYLAARRSERIPVFVEHAGAASGDDSSPAEEGGTNGASANGGERDETHAQRVAG